MARSLCLAGLVIAILTVSGAIASPTLLQTFSQGSMIQFTKVSPANGDFAFVVSSGMGEMPDDMSSALYKGTISDGAGSVTALTPSTTGMASNLAWSFNGGYIAFTRQDSSGGSGLYIVDAISGGGATTLVYDSSAGFNILSWAPDNQTIYYSKYSYTGGETNIYKFNVSTGQESLVINHGEYPAISSDGNTLAYSVWSNSGMTGGNVILQKLTPQGYEQTVTSYAPGTEANFKAWSLDSASLFFLENTLQTVPPYENTMRILGFEPASGTLNEIIPASMKPVTFAVSPRATHLFYERQPNMMDMTMRVVVATVDGTEVLVREGNFPAWTRNGYLVWSQNPMGPTSSGATLWFEQGPDGGELSPVTDLSYQLLSEDSILLSWVGSTSSEKAFYNIYSDNASGSLQNLALIGTVGATVESFQVTGLTYGVTYQFVVRTADAQGVEEQNTNKLSAVIAYSPQPPYNLQFEAVSGSSGRLTWEYSDPASIDGFNIYLRNESPGEDYTLVGNVNPSANEYLLEGIASAVTVAVTATNGYGLESQKAEILIDPSSLSLVPAPTGLYGVATPSGVNLSWDAVSHGDLKEYVLYWGMGEGMIDYDQAIVIPKTATTYTHNIPITEGTVVSYVIRSRDASNGESGDSELAAVKLITSLTFDYNGNPVKVYQGGSLHINHTDGSGNVIFSKQLYSGDIDIATDVVYGAVSSPSSQEAAFGYVMYRAKKNLYLATFTGAANDPKITVLTSHLYYSSDKGGLVEMVGGVSADSHLLNLQESEAKIALCLICNNSDIHSIPTMFIRFRNENMRRVNYFSARNVNNNIQVVDLGLLTDSLYCYSDCLDENNLGNNDPFPYQISSGKEILYEDSSSFPGCIRVRLREHNKHIVRYALIFPEGITDLGVLTSALYNHEFIGLSRDIDFYPSRDPGKHLKDIANYIPTLSGNTEVIAEKLFDNNGSPAFYVRYRDVDKYKVKYSLITQSGIVYLGELTTTLYLHNNSSHGEDCYPNLVQTSNCEGAVSGQKRETIYETYLSSNEIFVRFRDFPSDSYYLGKFRPTYSLVSIAGIKRLGTLTTTLYVNNNSDIPLDYYPNSPSLDKEVITQTSWGEGFIVRFRDFNSSNYPGGKKRVAYAYISREGIKWRNWLTTDLFDEQESSYPALQFEDGALPVLEERDFLDLQTIDQLSPEIASGSDAVLIRFRYGPTGAGIGYSVATKERIQFIGALTQNYSSQTIASDPMILIPPLPADMLKITLSDGSNELVRYADRTHLFSAPATPPKIIGVSFLDEVTLIVTFDRPMGVCASAASNFWVEGSTHNAVDASRDAGGSSVKIKLDKPMIYKGCYKLHALNMSDPFGNVDAEIFYNFVFDLEIPEDPYNPDPELASNLFIIEAHDCTKLAGFTHVYPHLYNSQVYTSGCHIEDGGYSFTLKEILESKYHYSPERPLMFKKGIYCITFFPKDPYWRRYSEQTFEIGVAIQPRSYPVSVSLSLGNFSGHNSRYREGNKIVSNNTFPSYDRDSNGRQYNEPQYLQLDENSVLEFATQGDGWYDFEIKGHLLAEDEFAYFTKSSPYHGEVVSALKSQISISFSHDVRPSSFSFSLHQIEPKSRRINISNLGYSGNTIYFSIAENDTLEYNALYKVEYECDSFVSKIDTSKSVELHPDTDRWFYFKTCMSLEALTKKSKIGSGDDGQPDSGLEKKGSDSGSKSGDPVDYLSGNVYETEFDIAIKGLGFNTEIYRYYNSLDTYRGIFGRNWRTTYSETLFEINNYTLIHTDSTGNVLPYYYNNLVPNEFNAARPVFGVVNLANDQYILTSPSGYKKVFSRAGELLAKIDPNGNTMAFDYNANGFLSSISDPTGRVTAYTYNSDGLVSNVTAFNGRSIDYFYDQFANLIEARITHDGKTSAVTYEYNALNKLSKVTKPGGYVCEFVYDATGLCTWSSNGGRPYGFEYFPDGLRRVQDPRGNNFVVQFNDLGKRSSATDPFGNTRTYAWNEQKLLTSLSTEDGAKWSYEYDDIGNIIKSVDPLGNTTEYTYKPLTNKITNSIDALGNVNSLAYDSVGNLVGQTDPFGNSSSFSYDATGNLVRVVDPDYNATSLSYDATGNLVTAVDAMGSSTGFVYDENGNVISITDANGKITAISYEPITGPGYVSDIDQHKVKSIRNPDGSSVGFVYDEVGNLVEFTDALGNSVTYQFDVHRSLTRQTYPDGSSVAFEYDANGNLIGSIDKRGNRTSFIYDALNRLVEVVRPTGGRDKFFYDVLGNIVKAVDPLGRSTSYIYDRNNRLLAFRDPSGETTEFSYDALDNMVEVTDANGYITSFVFDRGLRLHKAIDALNGEISYSYDSRNNVTQALDPMGRAVTYKFDSLNRISSIVSALGKVRAFEFDAEGNQITTIDPNGQRIEVEYDAMKRPVKITYADGRAVTYEYDANGNRVKMADPTGVTRYSYDNMNRLMAVDTPDGRKVEYFFNEYGELTNTTLSGDSIRHELSWIYEYDQFGRLATITDPERNETSYNYDIADRLNEALLPNGVRKVITYDESDNPVSIAFFRQRGKEIEWFEYTYDALGNPLTQEDFESITHLTYDPRNQLAGASRFKKAPGWRLLERLNDRLENASSKKARHLQKRIRKILGSLKPEYEMEFGYDPAGNRIRKSVDVLSGSCGNLTPGLHAYAFDSDNRLVREVFSKPGHHSKPAVTDFIHDNNGSLLQERSGNKVSTFSYDAAGNMITASVLGQLPVRFDYNGNNTRVASYLANNGKGKNQPKWKLKTRYAYSGAEVLAEFDGRNDLDQFFTYGPGIDNLISITRVKDCGRDRSVFAVTDALGSVRQLLGPNGQTLNEYSYTPFGDIYKKREGFQDNPFKFTGRRWDENVGKYWYRSRFYDPARAVFAQRDKWLPSILNPEIHHPFSYVRNNPGKYRDPYGQTGAGTAIAILTNPVVGAIALGIVATAYAITHQDQLASSASAAIDGIANLYRDAADSITTGIALTGTALTEFFAKENTADKTRVQVTDVTNPKKPTSPGGGGGSGQGGKSTGRTTPRNLTEQLAMEQAKSNPNAGIPVRLKKVMTDPRWPASEGWVKMAQNINGTEIHYLINKITGAVADFKFK